MIVTLRRESPPDTRHRSTEARGSPRQRGGRPRSRNTEDARRFEPRCHTRTRDRRLAELAPTHRSPLWREDRQTRSTAPSAHEPLTAYSVVVALSSRSPFFIAAPNVRVDRIVGQRL